MGSHHLLISLLHQDKSYRKPQSQYIVSSECINILKLLQHPFLQPVTALLASVAPTTERAYQNQIADLTHQLEELHRGLQGEDHLSNKSSTSHESNGLNGRHS
jgi:hypothetical protein